jgi:dCTP deaminase
MVLSDETIKDKIKRKELRIEPLNQTNIQPCSVDLHLDRFFIIFDNYSYSMIDVKHKIDNTKLVEIGEGEGFIIHPNEFILASTVEYVSLPADICAQVNGRSSIGRLGLIIHATAGFIDPGFEGNITLEMVNVSQIPIKVYSNMRIAQIVFEELSSEAEQKYNMQRNKYSNQRGPTPSMIWKDFEGK